MSVFKIMIKPASWLFTVDVWYRKNIINEFLIKVIDMHSISSIDWHIVSVASLRSVLHNYITTLRLVKQLEIGVQFYIYKYVG